MIESIPGQIRVQDRTVGTLLAVPPSPRALIVLAHGAGAGMEHPFMERVSTALADRGIATLRYQFPYMEARKGRPDQPPLLQATVRAACTEGLKAARTMASGVPLLAGGKSLGARMTSSAQAESLLEGVRGLVFLGFPLHPPKRPGVTRAEHLTRVKIPMLFLQGTRDDLADLGLIGEVTRRLGPLATLHVVEGADHSFSVLKRSGRTNDEVLDEMAEAVLRFMTA